MHLYVLGLTAKDEAITFASKLHQEMCSPLNESIGDFDNTISKCCGFCNDAPDCAIYGTCCLGMHNNLHDLKLSVRSTRSVYKGECVDFQAVLQIRREGVTGIIYGQCHKVH